MWGVAVFSYVQIVQLMCKGFIGAHTIQIRDKAALVKAHCFVYRLSRGGVEREGEREKERARE